MTWKQTYTGRKFDLHNPTPDQVHWADIGYQLAGLRRFDGALVGDWSVADHSLLVARIIREQGGDQRAQLHGLLHDAHEAYIGDLTTPVKQALAATGSGKEITDAWQDLERRIDAVIFVKAGLSREGDDMLDFANQCSRVKAADSLALTAEAFTFFASGPRPDFLDQLDWLDKYTVSELQRMCGEPLGREAAAREFVRRVHALRLAIAPQTTGTLV